MILPLALFFLEIAFGIWGSMCFHINFRIIFSSSVKNAIGFFLILFFNLFMAVLGLCCCTWAFSSCGEWGTLFSCRGCGPLIVVVSLVFEHGC